MKNNFTQEAIKRFRKEYPTESGMIHVMEDDLESYLKKELEGAMKDWAKQCGKEQSCSMCLERAGRK